MYPYTYDNITTIDLAQCSIFSHTLTDGFIGNFYEFSLGSLEKIFAKYGTGLPKLDLVKSDGSIVETYNPETFENMYFFNIYFDELGEISTNNVIWQDGIYVLKLYSDDSDLIYYRTIKLIRETEIGSTKQDITDIKDMINSESKEIQSDIDYIPSQHNTAKIKM